MQVIDITAQIAARRLNEETVRHFEKELAYLDSRIEVLLCSLRRQLSSSADLISRLPHDDRRKELEANCRLIGLLLIQAEAVERTMTNKAVQRR